MHRPFTEPGRQVAQQLSVWGRLSFDVEAEAVHEFVVGDRQPPLPYRLAPGFVPDPDREAVLRSQHYGQVEEVVAAAIGQAMEVEVGRREPGVGDGIGLGAELEFGLIEPSPAEEGRPVQRVSA
jgi:hypothetical protein